MDVFQLALLALIQGLTEFLPVSSSGHLLLPAAVLGWPDQGLAFDVAVHVGSLLAVLIYFRRDLIEIVADWFGSFSGQHTQQSKLGWLLIVATVPAGLAGLLFSDWIEVHLRTAWVVGLTTIVFGLLLGWADWSGKRQGDLSKLTWRHALWIGGAQALALIPGTSRSGITITMALMLGLTRQASARFSFLMSIPLITLSGAYKTLDLIGQPDTEWAVMLLGVVVSAVSAGLCIHWFLRFVDRVGMLPFVLYRVLLGIGLFYLIYA